MVGGSFLEAGMSITVRARLLRSFDPRMSRYRLRIGTSRIHRTGVFAAEMIPAGRKVIEYTGKRLDRRGLRALIQKVGNLRAVRLRYVFEYHRNCFVDGAVGGSRPEVINHSCDPNLAGRRISGHVLYFSRRQIQAGEELTVDYRYAPTALQVRCRCGSPKCRGTINRKQ